MKTIYAACIVFGAITFYSCTKEKVTIKSGEYLTAPESVVTTGSEHFIGERYGGGVVFLIDSAGTHGLIADTIDLGLFAWWNGSYIKTGATGKTFGAGRLNTRKIIAAQGEGNYAATACDDMERNGYTDWYLPSNAELNALYKQKYLVGGFQHYAYWSSTEKRENMAISQDFFFGHSFLHHKNYPTYVRAIRAF